MATKAAYYLIQFQDDPRRAEPANVGLALRAPDGWYLRFAGGYQAGGGPLSAPTWTRIDDEMYSDWVDYFNRKAEEDAWPDVDRLLRSRPSNFLTRMGGEVYGVAGGVPEADAVKPWTEVVEDLFHTLVDRPTPTRRRTNHERYLSKVDDVLARASVAAERDVRVPAQFGKARTEVTFRYRYAADKPHLMDALWASTADKMAERSRELMARIIGAREAGSGSDFVVFVSRSDTNYRRHYEAALVAAESEALVVDVGEPGKAATDLRDALALAS